ncbi:uncharacterized protein LOC142616028 [Castanea sativa]|uniref:uncharacterized protein LOC142616028 n=1 Tax=Castanea sativa TaxID=21020 RepID=UPI003F64DE66
MEVVLDSVDKRVTTDMKHILLRPYTTSEVKRALVQIHPLKSHGPNGNVISCIHYKVLANRLKIILPKIISNAYSAFVPDRLITDNTIVAFEVLHKMQNHRRGKRNVCQQCCEGRKRGTNYRLVTILEQYERALGQAINRDKTALFFNKNTRAEVRDIIQGMLGVQVMTDCEKYLGLPMVVGNSKVNAFRGLKEKITRRVMAMGWKEKFISKVGWKILIKTMVQVYKARYFPNCSFMEAALGTNPSYVWRSLLMAREIIQKGWQVGDGHHIEVAAHKWLANAPIFLGSPPNPLFFRDLVDEDTRHDELEWTENSAQNFTVKTAYKIALGLKNQPQGEHSQARLNDRIWKKVWKLNVPPKVQTLLWRACSNILPTKDNLQRHKVKVHARCEFCSQHLETTCHVLWGYPFARNVWSVAGRRIQKCSNSASDFFQLFRTMVTRLNQQELESWAIIVWALWNALNKFYFDKTQFQTRHIYDGASGLLTDYQHLMAEQTT